MATRKEQAALARQKILEAAGSLIKEKGYDRIRIADITSACGMSPGNFYHYYKSIEDVFTEIDSVRFYESITALKAGKGASALARLESYILEWVELMIRHGANYSYYWVSHYVRRPEPQDDKHNRINLIISHVSQILEEGVADNTLRKDTPTSCIAPSIAFSIFGCAAHFGITDNADYARQWAGDCCLHYIRGALLPYCVPRSGAS